MTAVLYIIMRNDIESMNPGKAIAQGSHASNAFVDHFHAHMQKVNSQPVNSDTDTKLSRAFYEWEESTTQGFGTVLVLEGPMDKIYSTVEIFRGLGNIAGIVHDPTYPIVDGSVVHHIPLDTCAYAFVPNKEEDIIANALFKQFPLHR
jgi:peptidyl-tRNA hydrolase